MNRRGFRRTVMTSAIGVVVCAAVGSIAVNANADEIGASSSVAAAPYRQLIGQVSQSTSLEASVPSAGKYALEYDVSGVAFFDTYVNETELGYVGGSSGVYRTRVVQLTAGGQLVRVVGPEGSGRASVYLISAP